MSACESRRTTSLFLFSTKVNCNVALRTNPIEVRLSDLCIVWFDNITFDIEVILDISLPLFRTGFSRASASDSHAYQENLRYQPYKMHHSLKSFWIRVNHEYAL